MVSVIFGAAVIISNWNKPSCPHEAKRKADAKAEKEKLDERAKLLRNTVSITVTNGTRSWTNIYGGIQMDGSTWWKTNITEVPNIETIRACKHCGDVVERVSANGWWF